MPIYFNQKKEAYEISRGQLYSNTPSDFDFKLAQTSRPLSKAALIKRLKSVDLAFPVMHGPFGEDGTIQRFLESIKVPFVGSSEAACKLAFDKFKANEFIASNGFFTLPSMVLKAHLSDHEASIKMFFKKHQLKRAIVKPATGGSSIAVYSVSNPLEALEKAQEIFSKRVDTRVVIEPFCEGTEFTVIILQNKFGLPVAVMPSEIEISYEDHQIFDYRKKYLATRQVNYHCPPRFNNKVIEKIQVQAEQLFSLFGMQDFARFDGWVMGDGSIWFSDFNPISGMEQNSFLFMQASRIGMSHSDVLRYILKSAYRRHNLNFPTLNKLVKNDKPKVNVLFGGKTAERQVSVMSGTNVWLKLRESKNYKALPYLLDQNNEVWQLPYALTLNHTVEEIYESCKTAEKDEARLHDLVERVVLKLATSANELSEVWFTPKKMSLKTFIKTSEFVFTGLHGGIGEDGRLQKMLEDQNTPYNGSRSLASSLCMNKYETGDRLKDLEADGVFVAKKSLVAFSTFKKKDSLFLKRYWNKLCMDLGSKTVIVKPVGDGCSAGIARLFSASDLGRYLEHARLLSSHIPAGTLRHQHGQIEMPTAKMDSLMFEQFIKTDKVRVIASRLKWETVNDWVEITMGILELNTGLKAMVPSLTVAVGSVLSLEEKFQGGTGVNITPPPSPYVKPQAIKKAQARMELVANKLGIQGYARIDAFMHVKTGELIVIEANSTPGLTPSTVIYHQALQESPPLYPTAFLEKVVEAGVKKG